VVEVDRRAVGTGGVGPITKKLQALFFDVIRGRNPKYADWVYGVTPAAEPVAARV
jgi:branched-chain amino acid aminotransferase